MERALRLSLYGRSRRVLRIRTHRDPPMVLNLHLVVHLGLLGRNAIDVASDVSCASVLILGSLGSSKICTCRASPKKSLTLTHLLRLPVRPILHRETGNQIKQKALNRHRSERAYTCEVYAMITGLRFGRRGPRVSWLRILEDCARKTMFGNTQLEI